MQIIGWQQLLSSITKEWLFLCQYWPFWSIRTASSVGIWSYNNGSSKKLNILLELEIWPKMEILLLVPAGQNYPDCPEFYLKYSRGVIFIWKKDFACLLMWNPEPCCSWRSNITLSDISAKYYKYPLI